MAIFVLKVTGAVSGLTDTPLKENVTIRLWRPTLFKIIPPLLGYKYFFYWLAHYLRIFKNREYSVVVAYDKAKPVGIMIVVPTYGRWKFMKANDVHFTSLYLKPEYKGTGVAYHIMKYGVEKFSSNDRELWTIVREENTPALKVCDKVGFKYFCKARSISRFGLKSLGEVVLQLDN